MSFSCWAMMKIAHNHTLVWIIMETKLEKWRKESHPLPLTLLLVPSFFLIKLFKINNLLRICWVWTYTFPNLVWGWDIYNVYKLPKTNLRFLFLSHGTNVGIGSLTIIGFMDSHKVNLQWTNTHNGTMVPFKTPKRNLNCF
jgi:hypothetical protein